MKNILITGAAGSIGYQLANSLSGDSDINLTLLDLKSSYSVKRLKKLKQLCEVIYGDVNDSNLMIKLIHRNDIIIHLASVDPVISNNFPELCSEINEMGTANICRIINNTNNKCFLIYASSVVNDNPNSVYENTNLKNEKYISSKLYKYSILRLEPVLIAKENTMVSIDKNSEVEFVCINDVITLIEDIIKNQARYNKKTLNVSGGQKCITIYSEHIKKLKSINKFKYKAKNKFGYPSIIINKEEFYQHESLEDYYKKCGMKE